MIFFKPELLWLTMIVLAVVAAMSAIVVSNAIATLVKHTKLGGGVAGIVIVSGISSLPELVSITTNTLNNAPMLAISNVIGANALTATFIAITYLLFFSKSKLQVITKSNKIAIAMAVIPYLMTLLAIITIEHFNTDLSFNVGIKWGLPLIVSAIVFLLVIYFSREEDEEQTDEDKDKEKKVEKPAKSMRFYTLQTITLSLVLIGSAVILSFAADVAASSEGYNLGQGLAGAIILATITSIPEVVSAITLTRLGMRNLAIGGIVGSHTFNYFLLFIGEIIYSSTQGQSLIAGALAANTDNLTSLLVLVSTTLLITLIVTYCFIISEKKTTTKRVFSYIIIIVYLSTWGLLETVFK